MPQLPAAPFPPIHLTYPVANAPWISVDILQDTFYPRFKATVKYIPPGPPPLNDGTTNVYIEVLDVTGRPMSGVRIAQYFPTETVFQHTDQAGRTDFGLFAPGSNFHPAPDPRDQVGPQSFYVTDPTIKADGVPGGYYSEIVSGVGLIESQHTQTVITFQQVLTGTFPPPIPPPPSGQTLEKQILAAAKAVPWMPVNNGAALWKYAQSHDLQDQQTDELHTSFNGVEYIVQVFNLGIVYAPKANTDDIKVIPK